MIHSWVLIVGVWINGNITPTGKFVGFETEAGCNIAAENATHGKYIGWCEDVTTMRGPHQ